MVYLNGKKKNGMKLPAAERGIFGNYFLFAASGGELTLKELKLSSDW
jgi:hypothetical protein